MKQTPTELLKETVKKLWETVETLEDRVSKLENEIESMKLDALYKEHPHLY